MSFLLPELGFGYTDLEPHIDARTMEIHYSKHHNGYTNNLNNALDEANISDQTIEEILTNLDMNNMAVRNNAGGYYNHCLFWEILNPNNKQDLGGDLESAINSSFDSLIALKNNFQKLQQHDLDRAGLGYALKMVN